MTQGYYKQLGDIGGQLIKAFSGLIQIAKVHLDNNPLLLDAAEKFIGILREAALKEEGVSIVLSDGRFYFQNNKLYIQPENRTIINRMLQYLEKRQIFNLYFHSDLERISADGVLSFARLIDQADQHKAPAEWLNDQLVQQTLLWVEINQAVPDSSRESIQQPEAAPSPGALVGKRNQARKNYAQVYSSIKEVSRKLSSNQNVGVRNAVRLVQKMVDIVTEDDSFLSILSTIRVYDDYTYIHSVNVAILSMCLGKQIGLDHVMLERLGLCGLLHDLGKMEIPKLVLNKRGRLDEEEFDIIKAHSVHSVRLILKLKASRDRRVKLLMAPFEHHMGYNRSGYPKVDADHGLSLFGRILTIADVYDAITSSRIYRSKILSPDKALGHMLTLSGTSFDPVLLKVFINMLGAYPVGTFVKLDTGEIGIVAGPSKSRDKTRPIVQLLNVDIHKRYYKGDVVDLSEKFSLQGPFSKTIIESMHPSDLGIQAAEFLL